MYKIRALQDFNFYEGTIEKASGVREKSRQIVELLGSNELIRSERDKARQLRNKFVGIDSRNTGYGGGGSGSYYGGGDNDRGGSSYDRGGRYGDSYSNDAPHNRRASTGSDSHTGRYGGGSYESDRPNRYNDDVNDDRANFREETRDRPHTSKYTDNDFGDDAPTHRATTTAHRSKSIASTTPSTTTATGGKLKVNIKKSTETAQSKPAVAEKNLLDTGDVDFFNDGPKADSFDAFTSAPTNNAAAGFDPFSNNPAPAAPVHNTAAAFDPFGSAPAPVPAAPVNHAPVFDPFAAAPVPAPTAQNNAFPYGQAPVNQFPPANNNFVPANNNFGQPNNFAQNNNFPPAQPYPNNNAFPTSSVPLAPANNFGNNQFIPQSNPTPQLANNNNTNFIQSPTAAKTGSLSTFSHDAEFGEFEGPAKSNNGANNNSNNNNNAKWGDLGKLVDLTKIEKNNEAAAKQNAQQNTNNYQNSFAGLDGFSKTPQGMVRFVLNVNVVCV